MPPRIAIPMPHSTDLEYGERAVPQYERAVVLAGGEPLRIPLDKTAAEVAAIIEGCDGMLLPGSNADVDPNRFQQEKSPHTAAADLRREQVDDLLLEHAYTHRKPVLGICYGLQSLNVFRKGSLVQHIPDFLPEETRGIINHEAGRKVPVAHTVEVGPDSLLGKVVCGDSDADAYGGLHCALSRATPDEASGATLRRANLLVPVNSSHHQSAGAVGEGLRVVARCPEDGIIEALEGTSPDHFVLAVQWHPERSVDDDERSKLIFRALVEAAR
jgi:putative glutamine amidotransferase